MPWIDKLPEVGDPILKERKRLQGMANHAQDLERMALDLRSQVEAGKSALMERVTKEWTLLQIEQAGNDADRDSLRAQLIAQIPDPALRAALASLDGYHTGAEALRIFKQAKVIRGHNLASTASESELRAMAHRLTQWSNFALLPVLDRVGE